MTALWIGLGAIAVVVAGLAAAESFAIRRSSEVRLRRRLSEGGLYVPFAPNGVGDLWTGNGRIRYRINRYGHRDVDRPLAKPAGDKRVLVLGDSFAAGWGVPQDTTFVVHLERSVSGVQFWNTSRSGNNLLFYVEQARNARRRFAPDALLVQIFDNTPYQIRTFGSRFRFRDDGRLDAPHPRYAAPRGPIDHARVALAQSALRNAWRHRRRGRPGGAPRHFLRPGAATPTGSVAPLSEAGAVLRHDDDFTTYYGWLHPEQRAGWSATFEQEKILLRQLIEESRSAGLPLCLIYLPHPSLYGADAESRTLFAENPHRALLAQGCAEQQVPFVDGGAILAAHPDPSSLHLRGDLHLDPGGHAFLAEAILRDDAWRHFARTVWDC